MFYKSKTQPHCRQCAKPIRKWTVSVYLRKRDPNATYGTANNVMVDELPQTVEQAQRYTNGIITAARRAYENYDSKNKSLGIDHLYVWDGETYVNEFFCSGPCAERLAVAAARAGWATDKWRKTQKQESK